MKNKNKSSIDEMLVWDIPKLARELVFLQETQREAQIIFYSTPNDDPFNNKGQNWSDSIEYNFLRGLNKVPEALLPYLNGGVEDPDRIINYREHLVEAAKCIITNSGEIAKEILDNRGPLPAREKDPFGEHSFPDGAHKHYSEGQPPNCIKKQLLSDTIQSLKDYAESIINVR